MMDSLQSRGERLALDRQRWKVADVAAELRANYQGKVVLVCWHHGQIPALLRALGAPPETLLPNGKWPKDVYDWVIIVSFDENGHLIAKGTKRISEHLLQGDSG